MFKGVLMAITSGLGEEHSSSSAEAQSAAEANERSYSELKSLVTGLGATLAPTVHKRVNYLVCSRGACQRNTQKVRKAKKLGVQVLDVEYLIKCKEAGKKIPIGNHILFKPEKPVEPVTRELNKKATPKVHKEQKQPVKRKTDSVTTEPAAKKQPVKPKKDSVSSEPAAKKHQVKRNSDSINTEPAAKKQPVKRKTDSVGTEPAEKKQKVEQTGKETNKVVSSTQAGIEVVRADNATKKKSTSNQRKRDRKRAMKAARAASATIASDAPRNRSLGVSKPGKNSDGAAKKVAGLKKSLKGKEKLSAV